MTVKLTDKELSDALKQLKRWQQEDDCLVREFEFDNFIAASPS